MGKYVTKQEVRNFTNVTSEEVITDGNLTDPDTGLIPKAEEKVDDDTSGMSNISTSEKERLALYFAAHLVKLKLRGAQNIVKDGSLEIQELDDGETVYSKMYQDELSSKKDLIFHRAGD